MQTARHCKTQSLWRFLREAKATSYRIEDGATETSWYSTASRSPGFVCVCHTTGRRRHISNRLPRLVSHFGSLLADVKAYNIFLQICAKSTRTAAPKPVTVLLETYVRIIRGHVCREEELFSSTLDLHMAAFYKLRPASKTDHLRGIDHANL